MKFFICIVFLFFSSINAFSQWAQQSPPGTIAYLNSINFSNQTSGISTGWGLDSQHPETTSRAYYTTDGGITWNFATVPDSSRVIVSTEYITPQIVYATGAMNIFFDTGSASSFNKTGLPKTDSHGIDFAAGAFFKSTDGGRSWKKFGEVPAFCYYMTYSDFVNENYGMAIGTVLDTNFPIQTSIMKTTNGGLNWFRVLNDNIMRDLKSIVYVNENLAFATGLNFLDTMTTGVILKTTNGGISWTETRSDTINYTGIRFINANTGFVCGTDFSGGLILKTTNQGATWSQVFRKDSLIMEDINFFAATETGIAYGEKIITENNYKPFVVRTSNSGNSWSLQYIEDASSEVTLIGSALIDRYRYYLAGGTFNEGRIYYTSNGGSTSVSHGSSGLTKEFGLQQNFPNPFNPVTLIRYNLPVKSSVSLLVFSSIGKEIVELVNEVKPEGSYEISFDAKYLPSGIYFYKLATENFSETKKMILIK